MKDLVSVVSGSLVKRGACGDAGYARARSWGASLLARAAGASAFLLMVASVPALAGPQDGGYWHVTPVLGYAFYDNTLDVSSAPGVKLKDNIYYGGRLGYFLSPSWGLQAQGGFSPTQVDQSGGDDVDFWHAGGDLVLVPIRKEKLDWFFLAGGGHWSAEPKNGSNKGGSSFDLGTGFRWWFSDAVAFYAEGRNLWLGEDNGNLEQITNNVIVASGGVTFAFGGKAKDADLDGIPDKKDKCPDTPKGAHVDATGCPTDADGDGSFDGLDTCPDTPKGAKVGATGCPSDADGDGVFDGIDQCADTPHGATVSPNGCPVDSDGDGVPDGIDQCANTPHGATVSPNGCPVDSDSDGIPDGIDQCPGTAAGLRVDAMGCPEVTERETQFLNTGVMRIQDIQFGSGKAVVPASSHAQLDQVGTVLVKWPELKIEVGGHTDSRGSAVSNQKLSEQRARAVLEYLKGKYPTLNSEQFSVKGYGESKPLVKNTSANNMAKNRRVEFKVLNKEQLKREVERRKSLEK